MAAASNNTTQAELRTQWTNPGDILSVLLLIGGDIVQKAIAQLVGYELNLYERQKPGTIPKSIFGAPLTPVAFSFGWVAFSFTQLLAAFGDRRLMPFPEKSAIVVNCANAFQRDNNSWVLERLLRDHEIRNPADGVEISLRIDIFDIGPLRNPAADRVWWLGWLTIVIQIAIAVIPWAVSGDWGTMMVILSGTLLASITCSLPQWKDEKWACRTLEKDNVVCLTRGNGYKHIMVFIGKEGSPDLETQATAQGSPRRETPIIMAGLAVLWICLLLSVSSLKNNAWYMVGIDPPFLRDLRSEKGSLLSRSLYAVVLLVLVLSVQFLLVPRFIASLRKPSQPLDSGRPDFCRYNPSNPFLQDLICPHTTEDHTTTLFDTSATRNMGLAQEAARVAAEFEYSDAQVNKAVKEFIRQMDEGLEKSGTSISQIPTYVTAVPNGTEKGLYMAVDLGGTNFRVCSINLNGDSTFSLTQSKVAIPRELMAAKTSKELFSFLAQQIADFLKTHHNEHYHATIRRRATIHSESGFREQEIFNLGFTFSFPVEQVGINKGNLIRWTKGFDIADAVGKDVCKLLQDEIDALHLPVRVAALVNDTVGTLMARSYTSPGKTGTLLGAIFGTGTNGAYVEKLDKVKKLDKNNANVDKTTGEMILNTEWGSFDNQLSVLPSTPYDNSLDKETPNPGIQMFEKRISGMFLGEILRLAIVDMVKERKTGLFSDDNSSSNDVHSTTCISESSPLWQPWGLDTSFLSIAHGDNSAGFKVTRQTLDKDYGVHAASSEDAEAVKLIAAAIGKRAARLSAVAIAAIVLATDKLSAPKDIATADDTTVNEDEMIDIGVDGSLVEFYPGFEEYIREAFQQIEGIGKHGEKRIRIGIAKDGSGVGAALIALVADKLAKQDQLKEYD
ncbi:putative glucokinase, partial [Aureobasidium melanogenum]